MNKMILFSDNRNLKLKIPVPKTTT